jgi:2-(1,2-epoxy-1,2-dihydrophenyl)acetyl-CoA isomerase
MTLARFDVDGEIGTITLNRPDKLNALSNELASDLVDALKSAATNDRVRALVITGAGRAFCAGGDIETMRRLLDEQDWTSIRALLEAGATVATTLESMPKPTIAAVNGPAAGGGGGLALACDLRIASDAASFGLVFNRIGLHPDWGGAYYLPRIVGAGKALELILSGDIVDANEGLRLGIFNRVVPAAQLAAAAREIATTLAAKPPLAVTLARRAVHESFSMTLKNVLDLEIENQLRCFKTEDAKEGISAFLEKRRAVFRGV